MSQAVTYNDNTLARRYTGFPLNSTLVSSYTPDTIRSIITHAAAGQPYSTAVWIRISRVGIQVSAQDPQIARTRIPVFIPIDLTHDIFMLPSINNVICLVYDEIQSNMKGVLLYVVHPSDAQLIRDDFRIVKQANNAQPQVTYDTRHSNPPSTDVYPTQNTPIYSPLSSIRSPLLNNSTIRQPSPRRIVYVRDNESNPTLPQISYTPTKERRRNRSPRKNHSNQSPSKHSSDSGLKQERKHKSSSPEKQVKSKTSGSPNSPELAKEEAQQQQQQQQQELLLQQQQQQQLAAWQAQQQQQQTSFIPIGIYNRYVPKTIPLPTGEIIKTALPPTAVNGASTNGAAIAYIESIEPAKPSTLTRSISRSPSPSSQHRHSHHHRRHRTNDPSTRTRSIQNSSLANNDDNDDIDTKQYLKLLVDEMQAMKIEMNKLRSLPLNSTTKGRSDSIQIDLKEIRSHIDVIRARMAMTPLAPKFLPKQ